MPLYDALAVVASKLPRAQVAVILRKAANAVYEGGGVLTDITSYGSQELAYPIRKYGEVHEEARSRGNPAAFVPRRRRLQIRAVAHWIRWRPQGHYVQLSFYVSPSVLPAIEHNFRTDERLLRHIIVKQTPYAPLPKPAALRELEMYLCAPGRGRPVAALAHVFMPSPVCSREEATMVKMVKAEPKD